MTSEFDPGKSSVTRGDVHTNDEFAYANVNTDKPWNKLVSDIIHVFSGPFAIAWLARKIVQTIKFAMRDHVLVTWSMGNLSYQTARTLKNHRHWIWWIWNKRIPKFLSYAENYAHTQFVIERKWRKNADNKVYSDSTKYTTKVYKYLYNLINERYAVVLALVKSNYAKNHTYATQVLVASQNGIRAAYNDAISYANHVRKLAWQYSQDALAKSKVYADKKASDAQSNAIKTSIAYTTAAILALIAGIIAKTIATQEEIAAAEAADAAWIAATGKALEGDLGKFGKDLSKFRDIAFITLMSTYVIAGIEDAKDTGDVTAEVLVPILTPLSDGVKELLKLV